MQPRPGSPRPASESPSLNREVCPLRPYLHLGSVPFWWYLSSPSEDEYEEKANKLTHNEALPLMAHETHRDPLACFCILIRSKGAVL